ncbi:MAG: hypothetical protein IKC32_06930 [Clostridia bacterium]|nr:hypothetical protein [Clostridia bacterium]
MAKEKTKSTGARPAPLKAPHKMMLLFTVVNRKKAEFYIDLLQSFDVNMQLSVSATGTAGTTVRELLGLTDSDKAVIISVITKEKAAEAMAMLDEKFRTVRGGKGIAYTVPVSSTIGVAIYQFLSNTVG